MVVVFVVCFPEVGFFVIPKKIEFLKFLFRHSYFHLTVFFGCLQRYVFVISQVMRSSAWSVFTSCNIFLFAWPEHILQFLFRFVYSFSFIRKAGVAS